MTASPVRRKNAQKTDAVYSTMVTNPDRVKDPSTTSASAIAPCKSSALPGGPAQGRQRPSERKIRKSRPSA
jgi:hypothetical protein